MKIITSAHNKELKAIIDLHDAKNRHEEKKFIAHGVRTISTLVQGGQKLVQLYVIPEMIEQALTFAQQELITHIPESLVKKISPTTTASGMVAVFEMPPQPDPAQLQAGLVLANLSDPGNMGTLIRTAAAMKVKSVVVIEGVDPYNPKVIQATAGTMAYVDIFLWSWHELLRHKNKLKLAALVVQGGTTIKTFKNLETLLVVGNEAHGIPEHWLADCDNRITIPMPGDTESLNAAVAGSIALYELFCKQP